MIKPTIVLVCGKSGSGKTTLIDNLTEPARCPKDFFVFSSHSDITRMQLVHEITDVRVKYGLLANKAVAMRMKADVIAQILMAPNYPTPVCKDGRVICFVETIGLRGIAREDWKNLAADCGFNFGVVFIKPPVDEEQWKQRLNVPTNKRGFSEADWGVVTKKQTVYDYQSQYDYKSITINAEETCKENIISGLWDWVFSSVIN